MSSSSSLDEPTKTAGAEPPATAQEAPPAHSTAHDKSAGPGLAETVSSPHQYGVLATPPAPPPRRFGKYEILDKIGGGGMGVVYRARDTVLGRHVALKTIRSGVLAEQVEIDRFLAEAKAIARLHDPHIVTIHDFGEQEGQPYFVMELLPGETLHQKRKQFVEADPRQAAAVVEKIARAVHLAHGQGILHRDLKPGNILLDEHGEPKVADFGLVKFLDDESAWTYAGQAIGTPSYMSPEQVAGLKEEHGPATDVWALGVVLFELLTGQRPFRGRSREELRLNIKTQLPPWPRSLRKDLHVDLEAIILKCLEKDPRRRYPTSLALAEDLRAWKEGRATEARPLSRWTKLGRQAARHWRMAAGVAAIATAAALIIVLATYSPTPSNPRTRADQDIEQMTIPGDDIAARLQAGENITVIGGKEKAVPFQFVAGAENTKVFQQSDLGFTVLAADLTILELLPKQPLGKVRLEAEAFHQSGADGSDVGIYVAHAVTPNGASQARKLIFLAFNEHHDENRSNLSALKPGEVPQPEMLKGNHARIKAALFPFHDSLEQCTSNFGARSYQREEPTWRSLKLEMSTENLRAYFDGPDKFVGLKLADLAEKCRQTHLDVVKADPQQAHLLNIDMSFDPRAGLGLYVRRGSAAFRNVTVSPW